MLLRSDLIISADKRLLYKLKNVTDYNMRESYMRTDRHSYSDSPSDWLCNAGKQYTESNTGPLC